MTTRPKERLNPQSFRTDCSVEIYLPETTLMHEWLTGHTLLRVSLDWYVLIGPDDETFDMSRVWAEWKPGAHSEWEVITETASCGCLIVHLHGL